VAVRSLIRPLLLYAWRLP